MRRVYLTNKLKSVCNDYYYNIGPVNVIFLILTIFCLSFIYFFFSSLSEQRKPNNCDRLTTKRDKHLQQFTFFSPFLYIGTAWNGHAFSNERQIIDF